MKRLAISAMLIVLVCALVGGATFAVFSDSAVNADNTFTAGTLDLVADRDYGDTVPGPMFYTDDTMGLYPTGLWVPGATHHRVLQIENIGSIDAVLDTVRASLDSGTRYMADKLEVKISTDPDGLDVVASGTLGQFIDGDQIFVPAAVPCAAGDLVNLHFFVTLPQDADDSYQGQSLEVSFTVHGVQAD